MRLEPISLTGMGEWRDCGESGSKEVAGGVVIASNSKVRPSKMS